MSGAKATKAKEAATSGDGKGDERQGKCWSCGSLEGGHDWRACRKRTDLTEAEKAAGAAAMRATVL